ncbi:hypothetical protein AB0P17_03040 [Streptomyces sp. NPDC088124]|uniref:hypothetical protein n=1 Tax=Streptomyces sp. NPDC088124 TaxID=3154654 RepID=UPI00341D7E3F
MPKPPQEFSAPAEQEREGPAGRVRHHSTPTEASTDPARRLHILAALERLAFDPQVKGGAERHITLRHILEGECWVLGEEYGLHVSDRALTETAYRHSPLLGLPVRAPAPAPPRTDGHGDAAGRMLSRAALLRHGERHHLIAEVKRVDLTLDMADFARACTYARAVREDPRFRDTPVTWDFWLIGKELDDTITQLTHQRDRAPGCAVSHPTYRMWVRTWDEIIRDCRERIHFYRERLDEEYTAP